MPTEERPNVRIVTLGCAKNEVDSEEIAGVLLKGGYRVDGSASNPDFVVINTCGFLEASKQESIAAIREAVKAKGQGRAGKVIVAGCLAQRLGEELMRLAPGADAYVGVGQMERFGDIVQSVRASRGTVLDVKPPHHRWADIGTRVRAASGSSAYLKLSEGCDHKCTFCTIPSFRGAHQSKPLERLLGEAEHLARSGVKELNLIAQDVTQYGNDLYREFMLPTLLDRLNAIDGIEWIRLLYFYPSRLTDEVIDSMANLPKVLPYIDIPLQHAHRDVLRRMHRPWDGDRYLKLLEKVRKALPGIAIRTTFIVGFPGETDVAFQYLLDFIRAARFDRVGAFTYSREVGTPSHDMDGQVPFREKRARYDRLMSTQQPISLELNRAYVGSDLQVLVEEVRDGWSLGRSFRDAPEIDGVVCVEGTSELGSFVTARITRAEVYDLVASSESSVPCRSEAPAPPL